MKLNLNNTVFISHETISRVNQDGTVIVMTLNEDEFFYKIDGVAAEIWQKFPEENKSLGQIIQETAAEYSVSPEQVQKDVEGFIQKAIELKLIKLG